jgi:putative phosphoribosyl transferase
MFEDRMDAGKQLAQALKAYAPDKPIILALPRGGVPIGYEIAQALNAPLDVLVVRKIGAPWDPEFGVGAIAQGVHVFDQHSMQALGLSPDDLHDVIMREQQELERRIIAYRGDRPFPDIKARTVIIVDDGLATGITTRAAIQAIKQLAPSHIILAVPAGPQDTIDTLKSLVDVLICLEVPKFFMAVGACYRYFSQVSDQEVKDLLNQSQTPL